MKKFKELIMEFSETPNQIRDNMFQKYKKYIIMKSEDTFTLNMNKIMYDTYYIKKIQELFVEAKLKRINIVWNDNKKCYQVVDS